MSLTDIILYVELITVIVGIIYYKKYFHTYVKYFLFVLCLIFLVEFSMHVLKEYYPSIVRNKFVYNIMGIVQFIYYFTLYYKIINSVRYKKWVKYFIVIFVLGVLINSLFIQKLTLNGYFQTHTFALGAILLITTIGLFFAEILNSEKILYFKRNLMFWISIGLVLFYSGSIPYMLSTNLLAELLKNARFDIIFFGLNVSMYSCFIIGFIISKPYAND